MSLSKKVKQSVKPKSTEPLWKGPHKDGITFSMLSRFLACRERFRIYFIEGLQPTPSFNHRLEYGSMWHVCEEAIASEISHFGEEVGTTIVEDRLAQYCTNLGKLYPMAADQILHWMNVCETQYPIYRKYWHETDCEGDTLQSADTVFTEQVFDVQYPLPSGRKVRLRGKWDKILHDGSGGLWLQENKTKGDIQPEQLRRQLTFDLQTMLYVIAMQTDMNEIGNYMDSQDKWREDLKIAGILYNVVRRPLSGGKHSIRQHAPTAKNPRGESSKDFYARLGELIKSDPEFFFMRWEVPIEKKDIETFKQQCLNPILENLCDWWSVLGKGDPFIGSHIHWRHPYGVYNPLDEGNSTDLDSYLLDGNPTGLTRDVKLFRELEP